GGPSPAREIPNHLSREPESVQIPDIRIEREGRPHILFSETDRRIRVRAVNAWADNELPS
ncbi:MAG TPA: hypothetical protein VLT62_11600, partial [Candidatus Methylomirabilis sp.]|nr:hypothetical protein [Candidatus Methylomirabilis sp.]